MPRRSNNSSLPTWRRWIAAFLAVAFLALVFLRADEVAHRQLHISQGTGHDDSSCALCTLAAGGCDAPPIGLEWHSCSWRVVHRLGQPVHDVILAFQPSDCSASRGPPTTDSI